MTRNDTPGTAGTPEDEHDLRISGGTVVSAFTGEEFAADVLVRGETISGVVPPGTRAAARAHLDATGLLVAPGFVDAHMHIESSFLTPRTFAAVTLARGTTTVLADPHEIVNVAGAEAMRWMIEEGAGPPRPSCGASPRAFRRSAGWSTPAPIWGPTTSRRCCAGPAWSRSAR
ncbi:amidohydrolase family protein [Streptomyces albus]